MRAGHEVHLLCQDRDPLDAGLGRRGGRLGRRRARGPSRAASRRGRPSTAPTSAGCCRSTSPTATRASRRGRSRTSATRRSTHYVERNVAAVREVAEAVRPDVALANHLVMGPADPRPRARGPRRAVRGQGPRQRAGVHGQAAPALHALRARGAGRRGRRARRLPPHRREPVGGDGRRRAPGRTRLGPPGVDVARFAPARARGGPRGPARRCGRALARRRAAPDGRRRLLVRARDGRGGRRARRASSPGDRSWCSSAS